jgi:hypothetical protein
LTILRIGQLGGCHTRRTLNLNLFTLSLPLSDLATCMLLLRGIYVPYLQAFRDRSLYHSLCL